MTDNRVKGWVFDIQRYSINDGPGIRTTVFFKGCPLRCLWCDNPESQRSAPEMLFFEPACARCYRCLETCTSGATTVAADSSIQIDRQKCTACGRCVEVCLNQARALSGKLITAHEVLDVVRKDSLFYSNSGGGLTVSGGEPFYQPEFLKEVLRLCQEHGIHTAVETCGYARWSVVQGVLDHIDLFLFDVKHLDPETHLRLTGVDNTLILDNLRRIASRGKELILRAPLIPNCNDGPEELAALANLARELGIKRIDIVPYHRLGERKYNRLGRTYQMEGVAQYTEEAAERVKSGLAESGLDVRVA